jgi:hypothetical protein
MADDGEGQQQQHGWIPQPRIPKFSGDQDWQEFHGEAKRVLEAYTFPPKIAVEFLLRSLEGQARKEVLSLAKESRDTTEKILRHLQEVYGEKRSKVVLQEEFNNRRQQQGESVISFCHALQELAARVNAKAENTSKDVDVRDRFIERVSDTNHRRELPKLRVADPAVTLQKVHQEALQWQLDEEEEVPTSARLDAQHLQQPPDVEEKLASMLSGLLQDMEQRLDQKMAKVTKPSVRSERRCYKCNKPGHFKDCQEN